MPFADKRKQFFLAAVVFTCVTVGADALAYKIKCDEAKSLKAAVAEKSTKVSDLINRAVKGELGALKYMSERWEAERGTPYALWQQDAANHVGAQKGLGAIEWVDSTYHVQWVEPRDPNQSVIGMDIRATPERQDMLKDAEARNTLTLSPPLQLSQGYKGLLAYTPVYVDGVFNGYMVAALNINDFFKDFLDLEANYRWSIVLKSDGVPFFTEQEENQKVDTDTLVTMPLRIANQTWTIDVAATKSFAVMHANNLWQTVFISGLIIAFIMGLCTYLAFRWKYAHKLEKKALSVMRRDHERLMDVVRIQSEIAQSHHNQQHVMNVIVDHMGAIAGATGSAIAIIEGDDMVYRACGGNLAGNVGFRMPIANSLSGLCLVEDKAFKCDNTEFDPRVNKDACRKINVASMIVVPLRQQGIVVGVLKIMSSEVNAFYDHHITTLTFIAGVLMAALNDATAHDRLRQSEETFRLSMHYAPIGMALVSTEGKWLEINQAICAMLGYSEKEMIATNFQSITHPEDLQKDLNFVEQMLAGTLSTYQMEKRYFHKDGHIIWALLNVSLVRDGDGNPKYFISQIENITESKQLKEELQNQASLLDLAHDAIIVRNQKDEIVFWNKGAELTYGMPAVDVVGHISHDILQTAFPDTLENIKAELQAKDKWEGELVHTKKNGQKIVVTSRWVVQRDKKGAQIGTLEINRDITEREQLMQRLVNSNTELERFAYVASHDMQEPLRMISGLSDILSQDYAASLDDEGKNYLTSIVEASQRMRAMVRDLLDYARVDKSNLTKNKVNGTAELKRALDNISELIREKQAQITVGPIPSFEGSSVQFMRLMKNLIANAIKYQPEGQIPVVTVAAVDQGDMIALSVQDNGIGIENDFVDKVFEPFRRLHSWDEIKGTGLGLAICKKIVENHGGKIHVTSTPGKGSIFQFTIAKQA